MIIKTDPDTLKEYARDASNTAGFCSSVAFPAGAEETAELLTNACAEKTPVTVCGNRTGLTGAAVPLSGMLISMERMKSDIRFDARENLVTVSPAHSLKELHEYAAEKGLFLPPDPTEQLASCGGITATNASGARTFLYGPVRNYVHELTVVLPTGKIMHIKRGEYTAHNYAFTTGDAFLDAIPLPDYKLPAIKNAAGIYTHPGIDLIDLFIGSEGILGIITSITFKLLPFPYSVLSSVAHFTAENDALTFIEKARIITKSSKELSGHPPLRFRALEYFDNNSLRFLEEDFSFVRPERAAAVWFELESDSAENEELNYELLDTLLQECGSGSEDLITAQSPAELENIKRFRHAVSYKVNEYIARNNFRKLGTDIAVPDSYFREFYRFCKDTVSAALLPYVAYGHFGNSHLHLNMLPRTADEFETGKKVYALLCETALQHGGTYSAEHGTGKNKREYLVKMYGVKATEQMRALKRYFDPAGLLNPGTMLI